MKKAIWFITVLIIASALSVGTMAYESSIGVSLENHMSEIIDGTFTAVAENYPMIFDGNVETKWCGNAGPDGTYNVTWKLDRAYPIIGYAIATANDNEEWQGRNPDSWILYGSNDGENWDVIVEQYYDETLEDINFTYFDFELDSPSAPYQYFKYEILELEVMGCMQISEFVLFTDEASVEGVEASDYVYVAPRERHETDMGKLLSESTINIIEGTTTAPAENYDMLFDDRTDSKWCGGTSAEDGTWFVTWQTDAAYSIGGYSIATANDTEGNPGRNPSNWTLYGSNDGATWEIIDNVENDTVLQGVNFTYFDFPLETASNPYSYFMYKINSIVDGDCMQISSLNLYAVEAPAAETVKEAAVAETVEETIEETIEETAEIAEITEVVPDSAPTAAPQTGDELALIVVLMLCATVCVAPIYKKIK